MLDIFAQKTVQTGDITYPRAPKFFKEILKFLMVLRVLG